MTKDGSGNFVPGKVQLRPDKRPRPIVLRANVGDCLTIEFENLKPANPALPGPGSPYRENRRTGTLGAYIVGIDVEHAALVPHGEWMMPMDK